MMIWTGNCRDRLTCISTAEDVVVVGDVRESGVREAERKEDLVAHRLLIGDPLNCDFAGIEQLQSSYVALEMDKESEC